MPSPSDPSFSKNKRYVPSGHPDRALFRVEFPFGQRPLVQWDGTSYDVLDISERGMRVNVEGRRPFVSGTSVRLTICFEDAKETVAGTVLRGNEREAMFQLTECFSLERIRREERRLIRAALPPPSSKPPPPKS